MSKHSIRSDMCLDTESYLINDDTLFSNNIKDISNKLNLENEHIKIDEYLDILWEDVLVPCIKRGCILQDITERDKYKFFNYMKKNSQAIKEMNDIYNVYAKKALETSNSM